MSTHHRTWTDARAAAQSLADRLQHSATIARVEHGSIDGPGFRVALACRADREAVTAEMVTPSAAHTDRYIGYCEDRGMTPEATLAADAERWPGGPMAGYLTYRPDRASHPSPLAIVSRASLQVAEPTGEEGIHTGRPRYRVECRTCGAVVHDGTTGPAWMAREHDREAHGPGEAA